MPRTTPVALLLLVGCLTSPADIRAEESPSSASAKKASESFVATVIGGANVKLPGGRSFTITMTVERWTTPEEVRKLLATFKERGKEALLEELRGMKAGFIRPPAFVRWPSWEVDVATTFEGPEGRVVRFFTERPIAFEEAYFNTRSKDFEFGVVELVIGKDGKGTGAVVPAAKVDFNAEGKLEFETTPFATGPYKLMGVRGLE